jgi:ABC-type bacteriocin/lantibiotic exporter with double-glycine peptidase domain
VIRWLRLRPAEIARTGDDTPARSVYGYVWRMSGWHQAWVSAIAVSVAAISMAPLELQRRIVNDAVGDADLHLLIFLGGLYLAVLFAQAALKYVLRVAQGWLSESAIRYTRRHLLGLRRRAKPDQVDEAGRAVSVLGDEVERLGGFVGEAVAEPLVHGGIVLAILGYMLFVEPVLASACLAFFVPQIILVPVVQRIVNRFIEKRIDLLRDFGDQVADVGANQHDEVSHAEHGKLNSIYRNRIRIYLLKFLSKGLVNFFNGLAPVAALLIGGYLVIIGQTSIGVVVAFISGFDRLADPLRQLIAFYRLAAQSRVRHDAIANWM